MRPAGISMGNWSPKDDTERRRDIQTIHDVGFRWMRADLAWAWSVDKAGTINTNKARMVGTAMKELDMGWMAPFAYTPLLYSTNPVSVMAAPKPEYYDEWENWVRIQVSTVLGTGLPPNKFKVEVWNEPNWKFFWEHPSPTIYVELLRRAHRAVKSVSPDVKVSFGGMAPAPTKEGVSYRASDFVEACYRAGMTGNDFDRMGLHPYNGQNPLNATAGKQWDMNTTVLNEIINSMTAHGNPHKRFDFTEFGYSTKGKTPLDETTQGNLQVAQLHWLRNHPRCDIPFLFNWKDLSDNGADQNAGYGLHRPDGSAKKSLAIIKSYLASYPST